MCYSTKVIWGNLLNSETGHSAPSITEISSKSQQFLLGLTLFLSRVIHHHIFPSVLSSRPRDVNGGPEKVLE